MTMTKIFIHGVPDTPAMWQPLLEALDIGGADYLAPALPGFSSSVPAGFTSTKDEYLGWLVELIEEEHARSGPVDLVGHDWGAGLCQRAAIERPDLIRSWTLINAVIVSGYKWHIAARIVQTPVLGELALAAVSKWATRQMLHKAGMQIDLATHEAAQMNKDMKRAILRLYRSAKNTEDWVDGLENLPAKGLVIWGDQDPYVGIKHARRFCDEYDFPLHIEEGAGHWAVCERPVSIAARLREHWD